MENSNSQTKGKSEPGDKAQTASTKKGSKVLVTVCCLAGIALAAYLMTSKPAEAKKTERPAVVAPVMVHNVVLELVQESVDALGTVLANESVTLTSKVTERIEQIRFEEGQRVKAGDLLIALNDREVVAQLQEAEAELDEASRQLERARSLIDSGAITESDIDVRTARYNAARARVALNEARVRDHYIHAPFDGVVGLRYVSPGEMVNSNAPLVTLIDSDTVKVDFTLPERFAGKIQQGMTVEGISAAWTSESFRGHVSGIDTVVNPVTRAIKVRALIPNKESKLKPGMLLKLNLVMDEAKVVTIPETSLAPIGERQYVMRVNAEGIAERVEVKLGRRYPGKVEVREGLKEGDVIVTHGYRAQNGQKVKILQPEEVFTNVKESSEKQQS